MVKVITIDGPAGAGKSTVAKAVAERLKFSYLDTGAMYRALTLKAMQNQVDLEDESQLVDLAGKTRIDLEYTSGGVKVLLDGQDVSQDIRSIDVTNNTFYIARAPRVRELMVKWQQAIGAEKSIVTEGRDQGTVVFPQAAYKFYLDADVQERCKRRIEELQAAGKDVDAKKLTEELKQRDQNDLTRSAGPLKKADDACFIDSTYLSVDDVVEKIIAYL